MSLVKHVKNLLPFLREPLRLPPDLLRGLHPSRNPAATWTREGENNLVVIAMPRARAEGWKMAVAKLVGEPTGKRIELSDDLGSDVWELCDGEHTVSQICLELSRKYKLGNRQTEVAVLQFLNMLRSRRLVGIPQREQAAIDRASGKAKSAPDISKDLGKATDGNSHDRPKRSRAKRTRRY